MANTLNQVIAVTAMSVRSIPARLGTSMVIVIGIAGVVGVLVALLSMGAGFEATLAGTGTAERAIVLRGGSNDELGSASAYVYLERTARGGVAPFVIENETGPPGTVSYLIEASAGSATSAGSSGSIHPSALAYVQRRQKTLLAKNDALTASLSAHLQQQKPEI